MRLVILWLLLLSACAPSLDAETWRIGTARVLAVRADPAEAAPGKKVTLQALVVGPSGELTAAPLAWAACDARTPLAEQAPVAATCLTAEGDQIQPMADGPTATWSVPNDVCGQFGPNPPVAVGGQPAAVRPTRMRRAAGTRRSASRGPKRRAMSISSACACAARWPGRRSSRQRISSRATARTPRHSWRRCPCSARTAWRCPWR